MKKDKEKVIGETFSQEKLSAFLQLRPSSGVGQDFHILLKAYRGLPVEGFARFLEIFKEDGRNLNAKSANGQRFIEYIADNESQCEYIEVMAAAGAERP